MPLPKLVHSTPYFCISNYYKMAEITLKYDDRMLWPKRL